MGNTTPVGFYNGKTYGGYQTVDSPSPYGAYDMAGNVWQWTADVYEGQHYRYMRGGSKADYGYDLRLWTRNNARPDYLQPQRGFPLRPVGQGPGTVNRAVRVPRAMTGHSRTDEGICPECDRAVRGEA